MFNKIKILPEEIANKIAAGEVIQRPESVVKELLENSLDAGAKNALVVIQDSGKELIRVVDDGVGMDEEDAAASFLRHATSKIVRYEDLEEIRTYGFRGEALASIAAVARVTLKTRRAADESAVVVRIDGGGEPRISREGREPGTSVAVQNLFYNTPARRKFLKSNATEFRHIYDAVQRVALSRPDIALTFISDQETILDVKPSGLQERVLDIFGERLTDSIVWAEEQSEILSISGFVGKPTFGQKSRTNQYLFLNRRYIVNRNISHAVFSAYEHLLIRGTHPFFLLFIDIDPRRVDVNVHPSKMEAKFEDEHALYRFVSAFVRRTLAGKDLIPAVSITDQGIEGAGLSFTGRQHSWPESRGFGVPGPGRVDPLTGEIIPDSHGMGPGQPLSDRDRAGGLTPLGPAIVPEAGPPPPLEAKPGHPETAAVWQVHNKYIVLQIPNGLMVIDQHVAHERVLYERALERYRSGTSPAQQLLFPHTSQLSPGDYALLTELLPHYEALGFVIKLFGKNTIVIDAVPPEVRVGSEAKIVEELLQLYTETRQSAPLEPRDNLAKSFACKAAVKAGESLNEHEMRSLLDQLFATGMPYVCPHGRPIVLKISIDELDRRFGRK